MPDFELNPFQELYVTDSADPNVFVQLFSDEPVRSAHQLFRPGNVVLKGTQGSGKSTLLTLFRPEIRLAYAGAGAKFPVPKGLDSFVAAGINLRKSGALDIGQVPVNKAKEDDEAVFPFIFADFLNYFIVRDLLETVSLIANNVQLFDDLVDPSKLDVFATRLASQDCWFGALTTCTSFGAVLEALDHRITQYRRFHVFTIKELPVAINESRTNIGEPIARCAECMRASALIAKDTPVFVRIDEIDRLTHIDVVRPPLGQAYRRLINKAIGMRDTRVSYRVGTRRYGWENDLYIFGSGHQLENLRDYRLIDLDDNMRRGENKSTWVFPRFAADALRRRLAHSGYPIDARVDVLQHCFGKGVTAESAAKEYIADPTRSADRILRFKDFPPLWQTFLRDLFLKNPLDAILATAWARQRGKSSKEQRLRKPPPRKDAPWRGEWWRKERTRLALMQIAARAPHRMKWSGRDQILALSSANITVFLSICHEIWDAMHRFKRASAASHSSIQVTGEIDREVQSVGIHAASALWYKKITEQPGGNDRQRFVDTLGAHFRSWLLADSAMSYPGRNGFSLIVADVAKHPGLTNFLNDAVAFGDLYSVEHTTKERTRKARQKWYLNPILSAYFQIPETHTKEPYYAKVNELASWLNEAQVLLSGQDEELLRHHKKNTLSNVAGAQAPRSMTHEPGLFDDMSNDA